MMDVKFLYHLDVEICKNVFCIVYDINPAQ